MSAAALVGTLVAALLFAGVPRYATAQDAAVEAAREAILREGARRAQDAEQNEMTIAERVRRWRDAEKAAGRSGHTTIPVDLLAETERRGIMRYHVLMEGSRLDLLTFTEMIELHELRSDRFKLWTGCVPMFLFVSEVNTPNGAGLTHGALQNLAESRLRAARLYGDDGSPVMLRVYVSMPAERDNDRSVVMMGLEFSKYLVDQELSASAGLAVTWDTTLFGTHGNSANYILASVSQMLDEFLVDYLRVNDDACG